MDMVVNRLSEIEAQAVKIIDAAAQEKKELDKQADAKIKEFDAGVDASTAQTLNELQNQLKEDMAVELARLKEETKQLVANLEADYDHNHKKLADNILKQLIEG